MELTAEAVVSQIGDIVTELLGRRIEPDENFFEAGLNSLTVTKLHTLMSKRLGAQVPVMALYSRPSLRGAATLVVEARTPGPQRRSDGAGRPRRASSSRREIRARLRGQEETR